MKIKIPAEWQPNGPTPPPDPKRPIKTCVGCGIDHLGELEPGEIYCCNHCRAYTVAGHTIVQLIRRIRDMDEILKGNVHNYHNCSDCGRGKHCGYSFHDRVTVCDLFIEKFDAPEKKEVSSAHRQ